MASNPENFLAIGFGGGSVPGIAANTALMGLLDELGIREHIRQIWGTSAGAVVGAGYATGRSAPEMLEFVMSLDRPGTADVEVVGPRDAIETVKVGGAAVTVVRGELDLTRSEQT